MGKKHREVLKRKYFASKKELNILHDNITLLKWEVLSKANKIGKELWGGQFTPTKLATDMGLSYATTKQCLSLDEATDKNWKLVRNKKISVCELAMICQANSNKNQNKTKNGKNM